MISSSSFCFINLSMWHSINFSEKNFLLNNFVAIKVIFWLLREFNRLLTMSPVKFEPLFISNSIVLDISYILANNTVNTYNSHFWVIPLENLAILFNSWLLQLQVSLLPLESLFSFQMTLDYWYYSLLFRRTLQNHWILLNTVVCCFLLSVNQEFH